MHIYICKCINIWIYVSMYLSIHVNVCIYVGMYLYIHIYTRAHTRVSACTNLLVNLCIYLCTRAHVRTHIHTLSLSLSHTHTHTHIISGTLCSDSSALPVLHSLSLWWLSPIHTSLLLLCIWKGHEQRPIKKIQTNEKTPKREPRFVFPCHKPHSYMYMSPGHLKS